MLCESFGFLRVKLSSKRQVLVVFAKRSVLCLMGFFFLVSSFLTPATAIDHGKYEEILNEYVEGGYFDYQSFVESRSDRQKLWTYLHSLSQVSPDSLERKERLAYWIDLYNASTIHLIEENYPVRSIKDLSGWFTSPFEKQFIETARGKLSLDEIEHGIIRPNFEEPRIHFALVCAARSCPPLRDEVYVGHRLDRQLEEQTEQFLFSNNNRFRLRNGRVLMQLSSVFWWYREDFGGEPGIATFVAGYLSDRKAQAIRKENYTIEYLDYNWNLNQAPGPYNR